MKIMEIGRDAMLYHMSEIAKNAHNIAKYNTDTERSEDIDLIEEFTSMQLHQNAYDASAITIKTASEMLDTILSIT